MNCTGNSVIISNRAQYLDSLVLQVRRGELNAFNDIVFNTRSYVYGTARHFLNDGELVLDAGQESYFNVFKGLNSYRTNGTFLPWTGRIVVNVCYGFLKKKLHEKTADYQILYNTPCPDSGQTETVVLQHQYRKLIQNAMSVLTKQERLAVELCYLKDLTSIEVARELKIVPKTALIYLSSATKKMKGFLEQKLCEKITC